MGNTSSNVPTGLTMYDTKIPGLTRPVTGTGNNFAITTGGGGGTPGVLGTSDTKSVAPVVDAAAVAAEAAKRNAYAVTAGGYRTGAETTLNDNVNMYGDKNDALVNDITQGQDEINRGAATNELNLRRSMQNIIRGIQTGIRSGGVSLANMGAGDSGASDALARAYAKVGNTQTGEARGEAATQSEELQRTQGQLNLKRDQGEADLNTWRDTETSRVRNDFTNKLDMLTADAATKGVNAPIDKSVVDKVLGDALARLQALDQSRAERLAPAQQWTPEQVMAEAIRMDQAGQAGDAFSVTGPAVNFGSTTQAGAPLSDLPIYVNPNNKKVTA